jgi:hypothetical protein
VKGEIHEESVKNCTEFNTGQKQLRVMYGPWNLQKLADNIMESSEENNCAQQEEKKG